MRAAATAATAADGSRRHRRQPPPRNHRRRYADRRRRAPRKPPPPPASRRAATATRHAGQAPARSLRSAAAIGATSADCRGCTQNFQTDHCRLHLRDYWPNHFRRRTFPSPRTDRAQRSTCQSGTVCGMNGLQRIPRQFAAKQQARNATRSGTAKYRPQLVDRVLDNSARRWHQASRLLEPAEPS